MKVKIGVIGSGWWVDSMYLPALKTCNYAEVVALAGRNAVSTGELKKKWQIPYAYSGDESYQKLLKHVDAVIIASPTHTHFKICKYFLENGVHVLCEKPFTNTILQSSELYRLAESTNLIHQVAFTYFYLPEIQYLLEFAKSKNMNQFDFLWEAGFMYQKTEPSEKYNSRLGNHLLADVGSHFFFLAYKLFGLPKWVSTTPYPSKMESTHEFTPSELGGRVELIFDENKKGVIEIITDSDSTQMSPFNMKHTLKMSNEKTKIRLFNDFLNNPNLDISFTNDKESAEPIKLQDIYPFHLAENYHQNYKRVFRETETMARQFCGRILGISKTDAPTFKDGLMTQRITQAVLLSALQQSPVELS